MDSHTGLLKLTNFPGLGIRVPINLKISLKAPNWKKSFDHTKEFPMKRINLQTYFLTRFSISKYAFTLGIKPTISEKT